MRSIHKIYLLCLLALGFIFLLAGCGTQAGGADLSALKEAMLAADEKFPAMTTVDDSNDDAKELFSYLSDVDYKKVEGFFLSYSSDGLADEVAVVRMKKASDTDLMVKSLKSHVEGRVKLFASYNQTQVDRAKAAEIFIKGNDVVLIISDNAALVKAAYTKTE